MRKRKRTYRGTPEGMVLRSILEYLLARRILAFRMNTGCIPSTYKGKQRIIRFGVVGMADVIAFPCLEECGLSRHPVPVWIEVKGPDGDQTPAQLSFQKIVEDSGHFYVLARSIDDLEAMLKKAGLK